MKAILTEVNKFAIKRSVNTRQLQSLLGSLLHMSKCVPPARIFVGRLLDALRKARGLNIKIDKQIRGDLQWFKDFARGWNGASIIPMNKPQRDIKVRRLYGRHWGNRQYGRI